MTAPIRLIAMDMDGTLLDSTQHIPAENAAALREAAARGIHLAICSGRVPSDASYFASDAGLSGCAILGLNGAHCLLSPHGETLCSHFMPEDALDACLRVLEAERVVYSCFARNVVAVSRAFATGDEQRAWATNVRRQGSDIVYTVGLDGIARLRETGVSKIVYVDRDSPERLARVRAALADVRGIVVTSSWVTNIEIMPTGVDKGTAVRALAERLLVPRESVMCVGDYDNDLPMLAYAGLPVAMANASDAVRRAARVVTGSNDACGVAQAVRKYALGRAD